MVITVGDEFETYDSFKCKIEETERGSNTVLVTDCSRTVESANKGIKEGQKPYDTKFKYHYVKLVCKHYGAARKSAKFQGRLQPTEHYYNGIYMFT